MQSQGGWRVSDPPLTTRMGGNGVGWGGGGAKVDQKGT